MLSNGSNGFALVSRASEDFFRPPSEEGISNSWRNCVKLRAKNLDSSNTLETVTLFIQCCPVTVWVSQWRRYFPLRHRRRRRGSERARAREGGEL